MADIADKAGDYQEWWLDTQLKARPVYEGISTERCAQCDEPIPEPRRVALPGVRLCVDCQEREERR